MNARNEAVRVIGILLACFCSAWFSCDDDGGTGPGDGGNGGVYDPPDVSVSDTTGHMVEARNQHSATLLQDGRVLITGGFDGSSRIRTCEIYNPQTQQWRATESMMHSRTNHAATVLPDGRVFVTGGTGINDRSLYWFTVFEPVAETWSTVLTGGTTATATEVTRSSHTATLLGDGRVLIAGGYSTTQGDYERSYEFYDPATHLSRYPDKAEPWMNRKRYCHSATVLQDGRVFVAGGYNDEEAYLPYCEIYDPGTDTWTDADPMSMSRMYHTAFLLEDGRVFVAGGKNTTTTHTIMCEIYDPATDTWSSTGSMRENRSRHRAVMLGDGRVLAAGNVFTKTTEMFLIAGGSGSWTFDDDLIRQRHLFSMTRFSNDVVLIAGGVDDTQGHLYLTSCELFVP
jgi:hypothetical protein